MDLSHPDSEASQPQDGKTGSSITGPPGGVLPQAVRFASVNQEIEPEGSLKSTTQASDDATATSRVSAQAEEEIRSLSLNLQHSHIQQRRMSNFAFEPVSVPVSRAPSNESSPYNTSREPTRSGAPSPKTSPPVSTIPTPPLTPYGTHLRDPPGSDASGANLAKVHPDSIQMAPQMSEPKTFSSTPGGEISTSAATSRPSSPSDQTSTPPTSKSRESSGPDPNPRKAVGFSLGPTGNSSSAAVSRDQSPSRTHEGGSGTVTPPAYPRPFTPIGDRDDPYSRSKRPPQSRNLDSIDPRFVFGGKDPRRRSGIGFSSVGGPSASLPRSSSGNDLKNEHRQSTFSLHSLGGKKDHHAHLDEKPHGSMSELKRFFFGGRHHKSKQSQSPSRSVKSSANNSGSGTKTPPHQAGPAHVPFADDHGLQTKYGKFGKILGSGAGGSVRLMKRSSDGVTFAVKQFRDKHSYENDREYNKKVTAEFCIGSTLHHGNIIETLDIIYEGGKWYEVMEYAPYDLFAIVMTGKMSREEIACCFLQIVSGVAFLHSMGLAHRDLKLDNVVVNKDGIMKLIDFGSASVFRYPFENDVIMASGVVGSDPYLAPEVYDNPKYDPQPTDIWSLAIIFSCMSLRRFPWKAPRVTDNSFKLFISTPTPGTPAADTAPKERSKSATDIANAAPDKRRVSEPHHSIQGQSHEHAALGSDAPGPRIDAPKQEVIKGPWRLLRLLPRETRTIMGKMLEISPKNRATLDDMLSDPWIKDSPVCQQGEGGTVLRAGSHQHTLEPGSSQPPAAPK